MKSWGSDTMWAAPQQLVNYPGHDGPGLLFGRPPLPYRVGKRPVIMILTVFNIAVSLV